VYAQLNAREVEDLSPRVRMALRLYVHGVVKTQIEAARIAGLSNAYFCQVVNSPAGQTYMKSAHNIIEENAHDVNALIKRLSHRAIEVIGGLMEDASKEDIRLRAAQDIADRGDETAKIQKHQVETFTLSGADARAIAESMVQAAAVRERFKELKVENFDHVNVDEQVAPVAENIEQPTLHLEP
jgi:predicted nucleotide-binding protein